MRQFIKNIITSIHIRTISVCLFSVAVVGLLPAAVMAWGPARATFTMQNPATYVTFNSITNNQNFGDERNFYRIRDVASSAAMDFGDSVNLTAGKEYEAVVFFHNNANASLNANGTGIAQGAYARVELPAIVPAGASNANSEAFVGASNANPQRVYDYISFNNTSSTDMALRLVAGSVKYQSYGPHDGKTLADANLFGTTGQPLGYDTLNGVLPGCDRYSGYITYRFKAMQPSFTFAKDVRLSGTKAWQDKLSAIPGSTVEYRLTYKNTGDTVQNNVILKDVLPKGLTYIAGSTKLYTTVTPSGKTLTDEISQGGMNIGSYNPGGGAFLTFAAKVDGASCTTLVNNGYAVTNNGDLGDNSTVTVGGECTLPTTGPVEIVTGFVGIAAITIGVVYYFKSRRELEDTLMNVQAHHPSSVQSVEHRHEHNHEHTNK